MAIDVSERLSEALLPFAVVVVGLALVLLLLVFRSILVPIKAAVGFLLSVGASSARSSPSSSGAGCPARSGCRPPDR